MTVIRGIGVDPGPCTGITTLRWSPGVHPLALWRAYQCDADSAPELLAMLLGQYDWEFGQMEHFVPGNLPSSPVTVKLENQLARIAEDEGVHLARRPMASVKVWASDKRMTAARAWETIPAKMVDARAAGKHCLYSAVHDAGVPDPLSKAARELRAGDVIPLEYLVV
jgi:hypothetical protein